MDIFGKVIPHEWVQALRTVQSVHPEAVMAGGCLRDLIMGGSVKDIDIFIGADDTNLVEVLTIRHGWRVNMQCNADYVETMRGEVGKVWGFVAPGLGHDVQVIQLKRLDQMFDAITRMDFAACQVASTGIAHCWTPAAERDFLNRTITMLEPVDHVQECRSLARADRFADKYALSDVCVVRTGPTTRISADFAGAFLSDDGSELILADDFEVAATNRQIQAYRSMDRLPLS